MTQTWTSIGHAAELLHCDRELIRRWIASGELLTRNHGVEVCLKIDAAAPLGEMAAIASNDAGRESALGMMLAKLAQDDAARANRAAKRNRLLAAALGLALVATVAFSSYNTAMSRVECAVTGEQLNDAIQDNKRLFNEREELRAQANEARADASELRGKLAAMEKIREADARKRGANSVIETIVAMLP